MDAAITAIGTANPIYKNNQWATAELMMARLNLTPAEKRLLKSVYKATGIEHRYSVLGDYGNTSKVLEFFPNNPDASFPTTSERMKVYKTHALKLAIAAIQNCVKSLSDFSISEITHLITVSCTGMYAPGIDIEIVQQLGLNFSTKRTVINFMGCYGAFNGIKVADAICQASVDAKVLVVCVELCTIHFQKNTNLDNIISNALFADGAAAVLIEANPKSKKYFKLAHFYCDLLPQSSQAMAWHIGDNGFDIVLSAYVPEAIQSGIHAFTRTLLDQYKLKLPDVDFFAIHPGGLKILQACEKSLGITEVHNQYAYQILKNYGNMSSATVLFVLKAIWDDTGQLDHDKTIFSCAFGPGLTLESMLLEISHVS